MLQATAYEQLYYPEGTPDDFQAELENEPLKRLTLNLGCPTSVYDSGTGIHSHFGDGIFEYRIGDEIECVGGKRFIIESILPGKDLKGRFSAARSKLVFTNGSCHVSMATPTNPARKSFGFVVRTTMEFKPGCMTGSASRYVTRSQAQAEVDRLIGINYPGAIMILDSE